MITPRINSTPVYLIASLILAILPIKNATAQTLLAHYEYECLVDSGCPHSINTATEANFSIDVYPGSSDFGTYTHGETADVTKPIDQFLIDYLASGSLTAPEPMEFIANMVGAGGSGQSVDKDDLLAGIMRNGPPLFVDAGYDLPLTNGIDLLGTAVLTDVRFQLHRLEIFNSDRLAGSAMRTHYRYEFLGTRIPEPTSVGLFALGTVILSASGRLRHQGKSSNQKQPAVEKISKTP